MSQLPARSLHRIVIVGGGAGGLELAVILGKKLGQTGKAEITLVDAARTHLWKPLLHQVAAGTLDSRSDEMEYFALARNTLHQRANGRRTRCDCLCAGFHHHRSVLGSVRLGTVSLDQGSSEDAYTHKILSAISAKGFDGLAGVVESDETYFRESNKGHRNIKNQFGRKPRKRGKKATKRGISNEQVCVLVAQDRQGHVFSQVAGNGRISAAKIDSLTGDYSPDITALCSDAESPYRKFAKDAGLEHHQINARAGELVKKWIFHIQHVNAITAV